MFSKLKKLLPRGIGLRFTLWFVALFTGGSILCFACAYFFAVNSLRQSDKEMIHQQFDILSKLLDGEDTSRLARHIQAAANGDESEFYVRVVNQHGQLLYVDMAFDDIDEFNEVPLPGHDKRRQSKRWNSMLSNEEDEYLELYTEQLPSGVWLEVGHSSEDREELLAAFLNQAWWITGGLLFGGFGGGLFFTRSALKPIRELIHTVSTIKSGDISARVNISGSKDELDTLKTLFNEMLDQIQHLITGMRATTDSLAHDIRTPVTRLRTQAELALKSVDSSGEYYEALVSTIENSDHLVQLLDTLMDVSEADTKSMKLDVKKVDVADLLSSVVDLYQFSAEDRQIALQNEATSLLAPIYLKGDTVRLRRVLANLLDNAIKYTLPGGNIFLKVQDIKNKVIITVSDTGLGIPAVDLPHIWERLFRGDQSRSERGMGLGLSFVKAIVELHGGNVKVDSIVGQGSNFHILLPK